MSRPLSADFLNRIEDRAVKECVELSLGVGDQMLGTEGQVYGDEELTSSEDFLLFYTDLAERNVLQHLEDTVAPKYAERLRKRFEREIGEVLMEV